MEKMEWLKEGTEFIEDKGEIQVLGWRHNLVNSHTFMHIRNRMLKMLGPVGDRLLYMSAKDHTADFIMAVMEKTRFAKIISKFGWGQRKIAENIAQILTQYGYGLARIEQFDPDGESIVTLENSCIASFYENEKKPVCSYIAGLIAGGSSVIFGKDYDCEEVDCIAKGDAVCRFVIRSSKTSKRS